VIQPDAWYLHAQRISFASLIPLAISVGLLVLTLAVMHGSAQMLARQTVQLFGRRLQLYLFGLPGTVVHEGSHVLACVLFGHRVHRVRWFDPQATDGSLGSVEHSYDTASAYQRAGTIVIGLAPLLAGAAVLLVAARHLLGVPFASLVDLAGLAAASGVPRLTDLAGIAPWRWLLFAYVSLSVGGSMHLSAADLRGAGRGAIVLAMWLTAALCVTAALWWLSSLVQPSFWVQSVDPILTRTALSAARGIDALRSALLLAVAVNVAGAVVLFVVRRVLRSR